MLPADQVARAFVRDYPDWLPPRLADALAALVAAERQAAAEAMRGRCVKAITDYGDSCGWANTHLLIASVVRALPPE